MKLKDIFCGEWNENEELAVLDDLKYKTQSGALVLRSKSYDEQRNDAGDKCDAAARRSENERRDIFRCVLYALQPAIKIDRKKSGVSAH